MTPFKVCTCCGQTITEAEWRLLAYVGQMVDEVETLELRNCHCASTIAVRVAGGDE